MKKLSLTFLFLLSVIASFAYNVEIDGIYYNLNSESKTAEVTHNGKIGVLGIPIGNSYSGAVIIPSSITYNGTTYSVKSIREDAFYGCPSLTSVTIPSSVTSIGNWAFYNCTSLTSVSMWNIVTSIGNFAFKNCTSLTSIRIPNSVTSIEEGAFYNCTSLTSLKIPNSVTIIGLSAFEGCTSLSISVPISYMYNHDAFVGCKSVRFYSLHEAFWILLWAFTILTLSWKYGRCRALTAPLNSKSNICIHRRWHAVRARHLP